MMKFSKSELVRYAGLYGIALNDKKAMNELRQELIWLQKQIDASKAA